MKPLLKKNSRVFLLKKNSSFKKVFSDGLAFSSGKIILNAYFDSPEKNFVFLGFAVSKRPAFNSVKKIELSAFLKRRLSKTFLLLAKMYPRGVTLFFLTALTFLGLYAI